MQKQPSEVFYKKLWPQACNFIKKEALAQVFFCEIFKSTYFEEHLRTAASVDGESELREVVRSSLCWQNNSKMNLCYKLWVTSVSNVSLLYNKRVMINVLLWLL